MKFNISEELYKAGHFEGAAQDFVGKFIEEAIYEFTQWQNDDGGYPSVDAELLCEKTYLGGIDYEWDDHLTIDCANFAAAAAIAAELSSQGVADVSAFDKFIEDTYNERESYDRTLQETYDSLRWQ
jgi:hypothetical protein